DEYLSSIREVERQIEKAANDNTQIDPKMDKPYGVPADFAEHFRLMTDMVTIAFQADLSRVLTFLVTREGTSRAYRELGIPGGHFKTGSHIVNRRETPMCNLFLTMMDRMGLKMEFFGDATGRLEGLNLA